MAHRPTFFLSSTIYDFRDLRSAIKFSLEERGCRVLASEFNDFGGSLDQHSYEACLTNIEQADYFVLLIGSRVGGWYDKPAKISITQQEYRTAYELHRQGRLRLVTFVREEIWQLREERKELERFLEGCAIEDQERDAIVNAPSKFANDANFVGNFIAEVGRNSETGEAVKTGAVKPTGNWIFRFRDFRDIHDVLQPLAFTGLTSEEAAYRKALQGEMITIMARLLAKVDNRVIDLRPPLKKGLEAHPITVPIRDSGWLTVDLKAWHSFTNIFFQALGLHFKTVVVDDALTSTIFLDYAREKGAYQQSITYEALLQLWNEIQSFNKLATTENLEILFATSPRTLGRRTGDYDIAIDKAAPLYSLAQRWINIVSLCEALIPHLDGAQFRSPELMPFSPISGFEEAVQSERVSAADLRSALGL